MRILSILAILTAFPVLAQPLPGDPDAGLQLAREQCVECHYVEKEWADLSLKLAPDFVEVASAKGINERALRVFFQTPHQNMPNIILTPKQTDDIISYILSLKNVLD